MNFVSINEINYDKSELTADFKNSHKYTNVYLGDKFIFLKQSFFSCYYISYESLKYAFRRVMVVPIGKRELQVDYLVIADKRKELASIKLAGHNIAVDILNAIKEKAPDAKYVCPERIKR